MVLQALSRRTWSRTKTELRALTETEWLLKALGLTRRDGLPSVSSTDAMKIVAVFACVRVISETVASIPFLTYKMTDKGRVEDPSFPLHRILSSQANDEMTAMEVRENLTGIAVLRGKSFAEIERDASDRVVGLWPLNNNYITEFRDPDTDEVKFIYRLPNGEERSLRWENVFVLRGFMGMSVIQQFQSTLSSALTAEEYGERFFHNNSRPGGVLEAPRVLSRPARERLKSSWEAMQRGLTHAHRVAILENGVTWKAVGLNNRDSQFLELRNFNTTEIARMFRVPPHKIADLTRATFSNIEHQGIEFVTDCVFPWTVRWQQSVQRDLYIRQRAASNHVSLHVLDPLVQSDFLTRSRAREIMKKNGVLNANEWRLAESLNPIEGGDTYEVEKSSPTPDSGSPDTQDTQKEEGTPPPSGRTYRGLEIVGRSA